MTPEYLYLKLLLKKNLLLDLDEFQLFKTGRQGLVCHFMGMRLASVFQPIIKANGGIFGREALLRPATSIGGGIPPDALFGHAVDARRLVQFDRLVRTLHLLNHSNGFSERELLFLNVHPRLLASVSEHGRTFEQILHYYSVSTSRVVIEIRESAVKDDAQLAEAVGNYRSLGYRIAVDNFGAVDSGLKRVLKLQPDIVKLDGSLIGNAEHGHSALDAYNKLVTEFQRAGIQVAATGIETAEQLEIARNAGADFLQGYYLGRPELISEASGRSDRNHRLAA